MYYWDYTIFKRCNISCENIIFDYESYCYCKRVIPIDIPLILDIERNTYETSISNNIISLKHNHLSKTITSITLPTSLTHLCDYCFNNYIKLRTIIIPTSIKTIPSYCFNSCHLLTNVSLPSTLTSIKKYAFSNCDVLESIIIPKSVVKIKEYAFNNCYSLKTITLPTTITSVGNKCFKNCDSLKTNIHIPNSIP
ncbi:hypothetical protein QTN25_008109 [Entamoeba marina]